MHQVLPATKNLATLVTGNAKMGVVVADMAIAAYQIKSERQYVELGFTSIGKFAEGGIGGVMSASTFYQYANIGSLMENCKLEKKAVADLGFCKAHQLSRLGKDEDNAAILADDIQKLVLNGPGMTAVDFQSAVDRILNGDGDSEPEQETVESQLKRLRKITSTAKTVEGALKILAGDKSFGPILRTFIIP